MFGNYDIQFERLKTYQGATIPHFTGNVLYCMKFPPEDETKAEMTFNFIN